MNQEVRAYCHFVKACGEKGEGDGPQNGNNRRKAEGTVTVSPITCSLCAEGRL